ncbi:MAG: sigma factor-like helix-turn-helix DNA-binding protein [Minisyncoccota bacterium]
MSVRNLPPTKKRSAVVTEKPFFASRLEEFLVCLSPRSREIVSARFGLTGEMPKTLEEIGQTYHVTRERVRQVIGSALISLGEKGEHPSFLSAVSRIQSTLEKKSGIIKAVELFDILAPQGGREHGALSVFVECTLAIREHKGTTEREKVYTTPNFSFAQWQKVIADIEFILREFGHALDADTLFTRFTETHGSADRQKLFDFLAVAKGIRQNVFGQWGLSAWGDIKPRGTREKARLVLKMSGTPMHFREIAEKIDSHGLHRGKKRQSHPQTVHNELIKDECFVLVGRGVYALSEWGYSKGTVKDVLHELLRKSTRPLSRDEAIQAVLQVRQVKQSTIIINLNMFFERVGKHTYTLKK